MKRFLPLFTAVLMLPICAVAQTSPPKPAVKAGAKKAAPAAAQPAPVKTPLLTREELRACKALVESNEAEAKAINAAQQALDLERDELKKNDEALRVVINGRKATMEAMTQERAELLKAGEELSAKVKEAKKAEGEAMVAAHNARAAAFTARADAYNQEGVTFKDQAAAHGARVDKYNQSKNELVARAEAYNRKLETWKTSCADRRYDENDEIAIKNGK